MNSVDFKKKWQGVLRLLSAASLLATLAACGSAGKLEVRRSLPASPGFSKQATVPDPKPGEPAVVVISRERAGRKRANATIQSWEKWYGELQRQYQGN